MRIGINTRFLLKDRLEGIGVYTQEVSQRLARLYPEHEWYFLFDRAFDDSFITSDNITPIVTFPPARHPFLWYWWFEKSLPKTFEKHQIDLFFSTDSYLSLSAKLPQLLTVHDLAFEYFPEGIPWLVNQYYRHYMPRFCHKSDHLIAISEQTQRDIVTHYHIRDEKISTIPNGVSDDFHVLNEEEIAATQKRFSRQLPYFLYVGAVHPRKNVISVLKSFEQFKIQYPDFPHLLLIVGRNAWDNSELLEYYNSMQFRNDVIWLENIVRKDLTDITGSATAMLYLSLYEGFGLPVLESISTGVAVITSQNSPMEEIVQDAGVAVNPMEVQEVVAAMYKIVSDDVFRNLLRNKSMQRSKHYHWDITARKTGNLIEKMLSCQMK